MRYLSTAIAEVTTGRSLSCSRRDPPGTRSSNCSSPGNVRACMASLSWYGLLHFLQTRYLRIYPWLQPHIFSQFAVYSASIPHVVPSGSTPGYEFLSRIARACNSMLHLSCAPSGDAFFRRFSTQATPLRSLRYPQSPRVCRITA